MFVDVLPRWERCSYWIIGISSITYSIFEMFLAGEKIKDKFDDTTLTSGWGWLGRGQDVTDNEWWTWRSHLQMWLLLDIIHILLSQMCFYLNVCEKLHSVVLVIFDLTAVYVMFGTRILILKFSMALVMYVGSLFGSIAFVWLLEVAMVSSLNVTSFRDSLLSFMPSHSEMSYEFHVACAFFYIRLLSFAIEKIKFRRYKAAITEAMIQSCRKGKCERSKELRLCGNSFENRNNCATNLCQRKSENEGCDLSKTCRSTDIQKVDCDPSLLDLLFYSFHLPTLSHGPIFIYCDFHSQIKRSFQSSNFTPDVYDIVKQLIRIVFWAVFIEFQFHFLYFSAFGFYPELVESLSAWAVAGIGYYQGQHFMIKYYVIYGLANQLSRFDGIVPLPRPRCICWIYSFTDMWKHFDVGLYNFIKIYIYTPLGGSRYGLTRQMFAAGMAFTYIWIWHGASSSIFIWSFGNFVTGSLEATAHALEQSSVGIQLKSHLSPGMQLRLKAAIIPPVWVCSALPFLYFFYGELVASICVSKLATEADWTTLLTELVIGYCLIHNAIYLVEWYKHKQKGGINDKQNIKKADKVN